MRYLIYLTVNMTAAIAWIKLGINLCKRVIEGFSGRFYFAKFREKNE